MNRFENKKVYFSGSSETFEKEELQRYLLTQNVTFVEDYHDAVVIIQGYKTPVYDQDKLYLFSKENGIELFTIEEFEIYFSEHFDIDSVLMGIRISKDQDRLVKLLKNRYLKNNYFLKLLQLFDWNNQSLFDNDSNRDVSTAVVKRFSKIQELNHNIQYSPIGIYYTALETNDPMLLESIYKMPHYEISQKNAKEDQPLTLQQAVALNPNISKPLQMQILHDNQFETLKFLSANDGISGTIVKKLLQLDIKQINSILIKNQNLTEDEYIKLFNLGGYENEILKHAILNDNLFDRLYSLIDKKEHYVYLSHNSSLQNSYFDRLLQLDIDNVNINLLKNSLCPLATIEKFLALDDLVYDIAIAHNHSLNDEVFLKLFYKNQYNIDLALAQNIKTPQDIVQKLFSKNNENINILLSQNTNTPIGILMQLQIDSLYNSFVANNETYKEFSRNSLGIVQEKSQFKRSIYDDQQLLNDFWSI